MTYRPVYRIGLNKPDIPAAQWPRSAALIAAKVGVDPKKYLAKVTAAGDAAFVEAIVLRDTGDTGVDVSGIPGARAISDEAVLSPAKGFAQGLLGSVGNPTAEEVKESKGKLAPGMLVGKSGLEARYDEQLRGIPGARVFLRSREANQTRDKVLHFTPEKQGKPLRTTLSLDLQRHAEMSLSSVKNPAALVAIDPATGHIRAAATSPANSATADPFVGRYPPGSVFKTVTALALLRKGLTPDMMTDCTRTVVVDGRRFRNYRDFPSERVGTMTLRDAMATSCNTALISQYRLLTGKDIRDAAASLGLGQDMDTGFASFLGSVPDPKNVVGLAESIIGQGLVESSPLAMAVVTSSIKAGRTVTPVLNLDAPPTPPATAPLTPEEAAQLRDMLGATVDHGTGRALKGLVEGAKTGTAQYGTGHPLPTHAWMIAYDETLAVAAIVTDGESGSRTVGPVLETFFS